jgi:DNA helicase II / ATP-dependent DNA helicase PcrA
LADPQVNLTKEQRVAADADGNVYVEACPGSGKTRVLVSKALREIRKAADSPRKVACITFTNAAVDEMENRFRSLASEEEVSHVDVGTIHSFCLGQIFKPFRCRLPDYADSFEIVSGDDERAHELFQQIARKMGITPKPFQLDMVGQIGMDLHGNPIVGNQDLWLSDCMRTYWNEFRRRSWIDFSLLLYESLQILRAYPEVRASLAAKYRSVLVDEFQDTTAIQLEILSLIQSTGSTSFFLVGDPHQSIYGFAGASPESSCNFIRKLEVAADYPLSGNFRSSKQVVQAADNLIPRSPKMKAVGRWADATCEVRAYLAQQVADAVVDTFVASVKRLDLELGECAVLAAWWTDLLPIARACIRNGIAVVGPGARPYKRGRLIAPLLEHLAAVATDKGSLRSTQRALQRCASEIEGFDRTRVDGWSGRLISLELHHAAMDAAAAIVSPLDWIIAVGERIDHILAAREVGSSNAFKMSAQDILADIYANEKQGRVQTGSMTIASLGLFADPTNALKLMTVHASKGREFAGVAVVHMNEGRFPHFSAKTDQQVAEGRRVAYVGATRAKRLLHLIVGSYDSRDAPSRFVSEMDISL